MSFGLLHPVIMPTLMRVGALGRVTFASMTGADPWLVVIFFGQLLLLAPLLIARFEKKGP